jgi:hypothetical protein
MNRLIYLFHSNWGVFLDVLDEAHLLLLGFSRSEVESVEDIVDGLVGLLLDLDEVELSENLLGRNKLF